MNTFGRNYRISIFGESHGNIIGVIIDGCPPGISLTEDDFIFDMERRKGGKKGTTSRIETDMPMIQSGVFNDITTGTPIAILFENKNTNPEAYNHIKYLPRPGHCDFSVYKKYKGFHDHRGSGHFSGRLTAGLVAGGIIAKKIIKPIEIKSSILEIGGHENHEEILDLTEKEGDSLGGIIECTAIKVPAGLGEPFFDSFESLLSHLIFSIPGIKGIEFGSGFKGVRMKGSEYNDILMDIEGRTDTNHSGGINAGISNGNDIVFRTAVRPTPSIRKEQTTIDLKNGKRSSLNLSGRHDICFCLRLPVIVESALAIVLADLIKTDASL